MRYSEQIETLLTENLGHDIFFDLMTNLNEGLVSYFNIAGNILEGSGVQVENPSPEYFGLEKNFFSMIFLYSFYKLGISNKRMVLYTTINQCLRGMVTGCDNILDDEYKKTLETSLPEKAYKFRSVMDIMVSDRVLFHILQASAADGEISYETAGKAVDESLRTLVKSGAQEASEEVGVNEFLKPEIVLSAVHHYKTGLLFQSPWAVPAIIEEGNLDRFDDVKNALYDIGMGCQIMDDMVDLANDISSKRHNYLASLIFHGEENEKQILKKQILSGSIDVNEPYFAKQFPEALEKACNISSEYLKKGTKNLFKKEHSFMSDFAIGFVTKQIGAETFFVTI